MTDCGNAIAGADFVWQDEPAGRGNVSHPAHRGNFDVGFQGQDGTKCGSYREIWSRCRRTMTLATMPHGRQDAPGTGAIRIVNCQLAGDGISLRDDRVVPAWRVEGRARGKTARRVAPAHAAKLRDILTALDLSKGPEGMNLPGFRLHELKGSLKGHSAVRVTGNWRVTFRFEDGAAVDVNYRDYH